MLKTLKQNLLKSIKSLKLFDLAARRRRRRNRWLILAYRGVSLDDEHQWDSSLFVPPDFLRRHLEMIKAAGANVLPLGETVEKLYAGNLPEKALAITFDDGNHDFYARALPIILSKNTIFP